MLFDFEILRELNAFSIAVRVVLSLLIGGILGLERGIRNRPAGFRTYMLVCLGAALVMMTNQYVYQQFDTGDPVRLGAQVISGIGFLGAGTIVLTGRSQNQVRGITTAAGLWAAACCGLAVGIGFYEGAIAGGLVIFVIMALFQRADTSIRRHSRAVEIYLELDSNVPFSEVMVRSRAAGIEISDIQIQKNKMAREGSSSIIFVANCPQKRGHNEILEVLSGVPGVLYIEELQYN